MWLIVGSEALRAHGIKFRDVKDKDVWGSYPLSSDNFKGCDFKEIPIDILKEIPHWTGYATPDAIYTIKCSHLGWDNPCWEKHKSDILHLKSIGCQLIPELYGKLVEFWKVELGDKKFLNLNKSKCEFFTDYVKYYFDHDYLHEVVAQPQTPMYKKCLKDGQDVLLDKNKFDKLNICDKVRLFREEITTIACERWLFNPHFKGNISWFKSYSLALKKTITNLTKNWACDFIVQNLEYFVKPEYSYFKNAIEKLGDKNMSKVDITVFEELANSIGSQDLDELVYQLASDEGDFAYNYEFKNPFPPYSLYKENPEEYGICRGAYYKERDEVYTPLNNSRKDFWGYEWLDGEGGGEGQGEYCYGVFKLKGNIYKAEWSYYSYNGCEYGNILSTLKIVSPKQKTVTVYE